MLVSILSFILALLPVVVVGCLPYVALYGTFISQAAYMCALRYRTCHPIFSSSAMRQACRHRISDARGDHDSFYQGSGRLIRRHNLVRDKLFALTQEACLSPHLEVGHLIGDDDLKPADILLPSWDGARDLCLDVSIVLPSVSETGEAARKGEEGKVVIYDRHCMSNDLIFCPFVLESTTSGFGKLTEKVLDRLAVELAAVRGVTLVEALSSVRQQLAFTTKKQWPFLMRSNEIE